MNDLIAFMNARLDERARSAVGAGIIAWLTYLGSDDGLRYTTVGAITIGEAVGDLTDAPWCADGKLLERPSLVSVVYDEREVLREVAAKRAIVAAYEKSVRAFGEGLSRSLCELVKAQANVWSDHPDYRSEWALEPA